ncbi:phosphotransferase [Massilia sp. KIM]|uniref:phosphotransferase n=1 Tax=Massilia sp. KIM TaxID=1955422 RepID=UPI00098EFFFD|nr:phosphotransferase [Massilia sp. KIM]OON63658.1 phosphotransferase [Massilia sp. KIM]
MKKIDLHIHTVATISDAPFEFCLESFVRYVSDAKLAAVAVTNHDVFDDDQFRQIKHSLGIPVFPGIEVNLAQGHVLVIADGSDIEGFKEKCDRISQKVVAIGDSVTFEQFQAIFGDLSRYIIIPHLDKNPAIQGTTLEKLLPFVTAGEVDSPKKFIRAIKDDTRPTPVLFSDVRIRADKPKYPSRHTYIDCGAVTFDAIRLCLSDKQKVALSERDGNNLWPVFLNGQKISTGLNILLGERSSGKTYTLNKIRDNIESSKYIDQFSLVQRDDYGDEREFQNDLQKKRGLISEEYLGPFRNVLNEMINIDLSSLERRLDRYLTSLLASAAEADRQDAFSKVCLYKEAEFNVGEAATLHELIEAVRKVVENVEFRSVIDKYVSPAALQALMCELIDVARQRAFDGKKKRIANELLKDIKQQLSLRTSATQIEEIDLYDYKISISKVHKFREIAKNLRAESTISTESIQGFKVEAKKMPFTGALEIRAASGTKLAFSDAYKRYDDAYAYLRELIKIDGCNRSELYKLFVRIDYQILNSHGYPVSGGERSEFRLLQSIMDAKDYDILLIDEPESSFDNLFLNSDVNKILKSLSQFMPVVVVTHNSTVGASIGADYVLYASRVVDDGGVVYRIYSGHPSDKVLSTVDGKTISTHTVMLNALEAGQKTYLERQRHYEIIED